MKIISFEEFTGSADYADTAVHMALGVFDGLHIGHRALIDRVVSSAQQGERFLFTFHPNPKSVLGRDGYEKQIITLRQKYRLLESWKIDTVVLIDFSPEFSKLRGETFFDLIRSSCRLEYVVIGENFSCGYRARFTARRIEAWFTGSPTAVDIVPSVTSGDIRVSSSLVREAVASGNMNVATELLGRPFTLDLESVQSEKDDRFVYVKTDGIVQILPPPGLYEVACAGHDGRLSTTQMWIEDDRLVHANGSCFDPNIQILARVQDQ